MKKWQWIVVVAVLIAGVLITIVLSKSNVQREARQEVEPDWGAAEQIEKLFSLEYGMDDGQIGKPQRILEGTDLAPVSFFVKEDVFYILDNAAKQVVVTDGEEKIINFRLDDDASLKDIYVDQEGTIYVLDERQGVLIYDKEGVLVNNLPLQQHKFIPTGLTVNSKGDIFVHQGGSRTLSVADNQIEPFVKSFGDLTVAPRRVDEKNGQLIVTESEHESVIDIPFEETYGALTIHDVQANQIIYEKLEVKDESPISTVSRIYVTDKKGKEIGSVQVPYEQSIYFAEHPIRVENQRIYFMSPQEDGVSFYELKPGLGR
ncbi:hypothetical protein NCCP2222_21890 [Sporosarcina sp. NCCP-2222]|uniref:hypothetical protein n=1 Tax=Sporosarcina sp. NCCP-2222 TaxID=2935073 RepID=UPI00207E03AD|nr:hypothetical protein [Sporosarcina sp. NCCP-2222]GKV56242.1 hypothetical protein NCCP2222_21890 [Sporosarcina sp. NCCP-2222]